MGCFQKLQKKSTQKFLKNVDHGNWNLETVSFQVNQLNLRVLICCNLVHAVQALKDIASTLGKRNWNFSADPCSGKEGWADQNPDKGFENAVTCNCAYAGGTVCHVVSMYIHKLLFLSLTHTED